MITNFPGSPHAMSFVGFSRKLIFQAFPIRWVFLLFPVLGNWRENSYISHIMKYTTGWQSNGKNHPFYGKSMGTNFPGIPHSMGFTMLREIWWENPCISHVNKYTIGWESNGKKSPILWEKYEYQFPRFSTYNGFSRILPGTNFPDFPHSMGLAVFSHVMGN